MRLSTKRRANASFVPEFVIFNTELPESAASVSYEVLQDSKALLTGLDYKQVIDGLVISIADTLELKSGPLTQEEISFIRLMLET